MAYNLPVQFRPGPNLNPAPRIVCPNSHVFGKTSCINCSFGGNPLMYEICGFLEQMIIRARNEKKMKFLQNVFNEE